MKAQREPTVMATLTKGEGMTLLIAPVSENVARQIERSGCNPQIQLLFRPGELSYKNFYIKNHLSEKVASDVWAMLSGKIVRRNRKRQQITSVRARVPLDAWQEFAERITREEHHGLEIPPSESAPAGSQSDQTAEGSDLQRLLRVDRILDPDSQDRTAEFRSLLEAAANGDPEAQYKVAESLIRGRQISESNFDDLYENERAAQRWYSSAAELGHLGAQYKVGRERLENWYHLGDMESDSEETRQQKVGESHAKGLELMVSAAKQGHEGAQDYLAWFYARNSFRITKKPPKTLTYGSPPDCAYDWGSAIKWLTKTAERGSWEAAAGIAEIYSHVLEDFGKAAEWFQRSIDMGSTAAWVKYSLGLLYEEGRGVAVSIERAINLYNEAAHDTTAKPAKDRVAALFLGGHGTPEDFRQAKKWLVKDLRSREHGDGRDKVTRLRAAKLLHHMYPDKYAAPQDDWRH